VQNGEAVAVLTQSAGLLLYSLRDAPLSPAWVPGSYFRDGDLCYEPGRGAVCSLGHEERGWSKTNDAVEGRLHEHHIGVPPLEAVRRLARRLGDGTTQLHPGGLAVRQVKFPTPTHWAVIWHDSLLKSRGTPEESDEGEGPDWRVISRLDQLELGECRECAELAAHPGNLVGLVARDGVPETVSPFVHLTCPFVDAHHKHITSRLFQ